MPLWERSINLLHEMLKRSLLIGSGKLCHKYSELRDVTRTKFAEKGLFDLLVFEHLSQPVVFADNWRDGIAHQSPEAALTGVQNTCNDRAQLCAAAAR